MTDTNYVTVPEGTYLCEVAEVRVGETRAGDERWSLRLVVADGEHIGRQAAWDSIVFSTRGRARARLVLKALGFASDERMTHGDLVGRKAKVQVRPETYQSPTGETVTRNEVPYAGYEAVS